jgi:hypothetical protein
MGRSIWAIISTIRRKVTANSAGQMVHRMLGRLWLIRCMGKARTLGQMVASTSVSGATTRCTGRELYPGKVAKFTQENSTKTKSLGTA